VDTTKIEAMIAPSLEAMGFRVVRVAVTGGRRATLQIMAERVDDKAMTVEDCADISRTASALLDVADPIATAYTLEVSSPGIDRPLVRRSDFDRYAGHVAQVEMQAPVDGRRRFRGELIGAQGAFARIRRADGAANENSEILLPIDDMMEAKLVLTDALISQSLRKSKLNQRKGD
jgi:ribosome maturation factor RimP